MTSGDEQLERMARSIQAWQRALGSAAAGGAVLEVAELVGSVVPAAPSRSILNAAAGPRGMVFEAGVLEDLGVRYGAAGATAWGLWVQEHDTVAAAVPTRAGLTVDSRPTTMALDLAALGPAPGRDGVTVERTDDLALIAGPLSAS